MADIKKLQELMSQYKNIRNYTDGGKVESDDDILHQLKETFQKAFASPTPAPTPGESQEDKYEKIRQQNRKNFGYAEGGEVKDPKLDQEKLAAAQESLRKAFHFFGGGEVPQSYETAIEPGSMEEKYQKMGLLEGPMEHTLERADISGKPNSQLQNDLLTNIDQPANEMDLNDQSPEDKSLEQDYANEDFAANEDAQDEELTPMPEAIPQQMPEQKLAGQEVSKTEEKVPEQSSYSKLLSSLKPKGNELSEAQKERDRNIALNQFQRGAAIMGGGMAKADPGQILKSVEAQEKYAGLPVQKYEENVANQKFDPNSEMSKVTREYFKSKGITVPENASYEDMAKIAPFIQKDQALQGQLQRVLLQQKGSMERTQLQQSEANLRSQRRDQAIKDSAGIRAEMTAAGQKKADDRSSKRAVLQIVQRINNDPVIKPSRQNKASLDKALSIMSNKSVPLTPQFLADAEQDISSALQLRGQGATEGKIKRTELVTLGRKIAEAKQKWGNKPDIDLRKDEPALVNVIFKAAKAIRDDYTTTIQQGQKEIAEQYESALGDDPIINKAIQKFKGVSESAAGMHKPGDVVMVKGKKYKVGADGDSLEEVQ